MSVRFSCTLSAALLGLCLVATASAHTHVRHAKHHEKKVAAPTLIWRGDVATASGVMDDVAKAWKKAGHGEIEMQPFNTASGIDAVNTGAADLAGSARAADPTSEDGRLTFTPVAWDALVIIVQASNPVNSLTLKQVHDIYYGKIHNWKEVGGSDAPIDVYAVASPGDGIEYSLRSLLFGRGSQAVAAPRLYLNTHQLEAGVSLNPNGMGVSTLADMHSNSKVVAKLKALSISDVAPTATNIASGSYPLYTPLYMVTNPTSPKATEAAAFVAFLSSEPGKAALVEHGILPYSDGTQLAAMNEARRSKILAEVGERVPHSTPISAPGATYAALAAQSPTSPRTLAAKDALLNRRQADAAEAAKPAAGVATANASAPAGSSTAAQPNPGNAAPAAASQAAAVAAAFSKINAKADSAASTGGSKTYTVVKGDTLSKIAHTHSVEVAQLREWNHLRGDQIKLGQTLRVGAN